MTRTALLAWSSVAVGAALVMSSCAQSKTSRVVIIRDGSVELETPQGTLGHVATSPGKKHEWLADGQRVIGKIVRIDDCSGQVSTPRPFDKVEIDVTGEQGNDVTLVFKNEGVPNVRFGLVTVFGGPYEITGQGEKYELRHSEDPSVRLKIRAVRVFHQQKTNPFNFARTCVEFGAGAPD